MAARKNTVKSPTVVRDDCGTRRGYNYHVKYDEYPCPPCKEANSARFRQWYDTYGRENEKSRYKNNRKKPEYKEQRDNTNRAYRAAKVESEHDDYSVADILHIYGIECYLCEETIDLKAPRRVGIEGWERGLHLDHVQSLKRGGLDTIDNIKPTHAVCNIRKSARNLKEVKEDAMRR